MHFPDARIVRAIHRTESAVTGEAALEFFRHFLHRALFERVGAAAEDKGGAYDKESGSEGFQARRILKKEASDK